MTPLDLLVACYSGGQVGPSLFRYNDSTKQAKSVLEENNLSYVIKHDKFYYAVAEHQDGAVLTLDQQFNVLSKVGSKGDDPCHLAISSKGKHLAATNYTSGTTVIYNLTQGIPTSIHTLIISQTPGAHHHSSIFVQNDALFFMADLGTNIVFFYEFFEKEVVWREEKSLKLPGSGPRSLIAGEKDSKLLYLTCELDNTLRVLTYRRGGLEQLAVVTMSNNPSNFPSDVRYLKGQVLVALRGDNEIVAYATKQEYLRETARWKVGNWPRQLAISEQGYVFVACQRQNEVQKYHLSSMGNIFISSFPLTTPACILIL